MKGTDTNICCKLTSAELRERKTSVIAALKTAVIDRQEIPDGFVYSFQGTDAILELLAGFIRSERECCPFFKFELTVRDIKNPVWLKISGPEGAKEFLRQELDL